MRHLVQYKYTHTIQSSMYHTINDKASIVYSIVYMYVKPKPSNQNSGPQYWCLQLTLFSSLQYCMPRLIIASASICTAVTIFLYTSPANSALSLSVYPLPWMIRICLMNVLFPASPVPKCNKGPVATTQCWYTYCNCRNVGGLCFRKKLGVHKTADKTCVCTWSVGSLVQTWNKRKLNLHEYFYHYYIIPVHADRQISH